VLKTVNKITQDLPCVMQKFRKLKGKHKQFEVKTGSKFKPSKMTPYTTCIFWFSSLQLKKAHGQSVISKDIGGNLMTCKNTITLISRILALNF